MTVALHPAVAKLTETEHSYARNPHSSRQMGGQVAFMVAEGLDEPARSTDWPYELDLPFAPISLKKPRPTGAMG